MSFLNPILAWFGVAAVSVPILIHLLNKRKYDRVVWAAMRFLKVSVEQNQRRIQIEDIILLLLRCAVMALLGLALARPTLGCSSPVLGDRTVTAVIVLDNSYSMSATDGVKSRFDQAKIAADQVLNTMPNGSAAAVVLASDLANPVIPEPTHDLTKVRRTIQEARLTSRGSNLYPSIKLALDTLKGRSTLRKEVYVFTDGQLVAWKQMSEAYKLIEKEKSDVKTSVVLVGSHEDENLAVTSLRMASGIAAVDRELRFEAEVRNYGSKPVENVRVTLRVDAAEPSDEQTIAQIPAGASKTISLHGRLHTEGFHSVTAAIAADHLPADDVRTIAVRAVTQVKVLLVDGGTTTTGRDAETFYLRHALLPVPPSMQDGYFMKVATIPASDLDTTRLEGYDAVILANVADFSARTLEGFADYLRRGGGLIFFPGDATAASFYNDQLSKLYHFLPATLGLAKGDARREDRYVTLQKNQFQHPISAIWSDPSNGTPSSAKVYRAFELTPVDDSLPAGQTPSPSDKSAQFAAEAGQPRVVLSFGTAVGGFDDSLTGKPAVIERTWGLGRVVLFASTASSRWTNLPVAAGGGVLPLLDRTVASIVERQDEALNLRVGDTFVYHPGDEAIGKEALFFKPGQKEEATDSRQIQLPRAGGLPILTYDQTDVAGEYVVKMPYGPPITFAAQIETGNNESTLDEVSKQQLDQLSNAATITHWSPGDDLQVSIEKTRTGTELWMHFAWTLLALAALEMFFGELV